MYGVNFWFLYKGTFETTNVLLWIERTVQIIRREPLNENVLFFIK